MTWTEGDFKIFAAGLAIGGKYNHTHGTLPRVQSTYATGTYWYMPQIHLFSDFAGIPIYFRTTLMPLTFQLYTGQLLSIIDTLTLFVFAARGEGLSPLSVFRYTIDSDLRQNDNIISVTNLLPLVIDQVNISFDTITIDQSDVAVIETLPTITQNVIGTLIDQGQPGPPIPF